MAETPSKSMFHYQIDPLIKPGANLSVWVWLALLGIPALLLMLVYAKTEERQHQHERYSAPHSVSAPQAHHR